MAEVLYEDDEVRAVGQPGASDYTLITFTDTQFDPDNGGFFAQRPATKLGIECLGIVAERRNWYPVAAMNKLLAAVLPMLPPARSRVLFGGSMGGYGALKYSAALNAEQVIALCPQWGIDPVELDGQPSEWSRFHGPASGGAGIQAVDTAGRLFVFVDLFDEEDRFHAMRISQRCPGTTIVNMPFVGHHVTSVLAGTDRLATLLQGCRTSDHAGIARLTRRARQESFWRARQVLERARPRLPRLTAAIVAQRAASDVRYLGLMHGEEPGSRPHDAASSGLRNGSTAMLVTRHDTALAFNAKEAVVYAVPHAGGRTVTGDPLIGMQRVGSCAVLTALVDSVPCILWVSPEGLLVADYPWQPDWALPQFVVERSPGSAGFRLIANGRYVSAQPDGAVMCNRPDAGDWEVFRSIPADATA